MSRQPRPRPCVRLRELLAVSKAESIDFDEAWADALARMTSEKSWPHATVVRHEWRAAIDASKEEYRRCYQNEDGPFSRIISAITTFTAPEEIVADDGVVDALVVA